MITRSIDLFSLYWPLLAAALCLIVVAFPQTVFEKSGLLRISLFDFVSIEHGLHKNLVRLIAFVIACCLLTVPAFRDYSRFFPESLKVTVFFDDEGIKRALESLPSHDLVRLSLAPDWQLRRRNYLAKINDDLKKLAIPFSFSDVPGQTSATGELKFKVQAIDKWGAQLYRIVEAKGSLVHTTETPGTEQYRIISEYELVNSEGSIIDGSIKDVYLNHGMMILPVFKQLYRVSLAKEAFHHSLIAATRINVFPYIDISKTIYLLQDFDGLSIPIAYGNYSLP